VLTGFKYAPNKIAARIDLNQGALCNACVTLAQSILGFSQTLMRVGMMNISGVVVHALPGKLDNVRSALEAVCGLEIHAATDDGRLVVTLEDEDYRRMADTVMNLHRLEGVLSAAMVYQYSDE
jgi:periplasmic nitrate reductase NapD